jgi:hypothetical protein
MRPTSPPTFDALRRIDQLLDAILALDPLLPLDDVALVFRKFAPLFQLRNQLGPARKLGDRQQWTSG